MKAIKLLICSIVCLFTFSGCEKEVIETSIVGKWHATKVEYYLDGKIHKTEEGALDLGVCFFTFTEFGQIILDLDGDVEERRYKIEGDRLYISSEDQVLTIKKLTKKELILSAESEVDGIRDSNGNVLDGMHHVEERMFFRFVE